MSVQEVYFLNKQAKVFYEKREYSTFLSLLALQQRKFLEAVAAGQKTLSPISLSLDISINQASAIASVLGKDGLIRRENGCYQIVDDELRKFLEIFDERRKI